MARTYFSFYLLFLQNTKYWSLKLELFDIISRIIGGGDHQMNSPKQSNRNEELENLVALVI